MKKKHKQSPLSSNTTYGPIASLSYLQTKFQRQQQKNILALIFGDKEFSSKFSAFIELCQSSCVWMILYTVLMLATFVFSFHFKHRYTQTDRWRCFMPWFTCQMPTTVTRAPEQSQEPRLQSMSPTWMTGTQVLGLSPAAFQWVC